MPAGLIAPQNQTENEMRTTLSHLSIQELALYCTHEINIFRQTGKGDDRYALEAFYRAILGPNEKVRDEAWELIFHLFSPLVLSWMNNITGARQLIQKEGGNISLSLLNAVFAKVAMTFKRQTEKITHFASLGAILSYLKRITHSVVADEVRSQRSSLCQETSDLMEANTIAVKDPLSEVVHNEQARAFWRIIEEETFDDELLYLKLSFIYGMKPAEIAATHPDAFPKVQDVYQIRRTALARLAGNSRLRELQNTR